MEDITLSQCLKGAWRDAAESVRRMPTLFLLAFVLVLATGIAGYQEQLSESPSASSLSSMTNSSALHSAALGHSLTSLGLAFLQSLVIAVLAVQVIRFAMTLNPEPDAAAPAQATRLWDAGFRRYFLLCIALVAAYVGATVVVVIAWILMRLAGLSSGTSMAATATLAVLALCGMSYVSGRLALLFPHTAAGGHLAWRAAWEDTRGHFWAIASTAVVAILPIVAIATVFTVLAEMLATAGSIDSLSVGLLVVQSVVTLLYTATTATCSVWLYKKFGAGLKAQP
ncbi:hypothetical protein AWB64_03845 [Caballeronia sordidicola]|uniref:Uncharacterized protein n=1 Tax=Caballeronia sordidicola TaxID=196367 RepID=A0A158GZF1_CABSO|nr:hypothetical protein [Caballeronia sordidicola]SAL37458.1 hypothetical protein AWB64_03845 [Caballeronia sordidicola]